MVIVVGCVEGRLGGELTGLTTRMGSRCEEGDGGI